MLFNSYQFLLFFPIVIVLYYMVPHKWRNYLLLAGSYYFYMCYDVRYVFLLLGATLVAYLAGLLIERFNRQESHSSKAKVVLISQISINVLLLMIFKYLGFLVDNLNKIVSVIGINFSIPSVNILLPIGISFYFFQTMGYVIDIYRGERKEAEHNFAIFALFVSFFPQLVAGPIERTNNLLPQFYEKHKFDKNAFIDNLQLMLWGYFMKIVIADRIAIYVDEIYGDYYKYNGWYLVLASILFAFQIYCDFSGYSTIAIGAAGAMGFKLMENFKSPYCAVSVKDFWKRWHISLTGWFRDYLYIPLGGNRKGKIRKYINEMFVFLISGLWHGAMWNYVIWGGLNGLLRILEDIFKPIGEKIGKMLRINKNASANKVVAGIFTFICVDFTWVFFRASGTTEALNIFKNMFPLRNLNIFFDESVYASLDEKNFKLMILSIIVLIIVDVLHDHDLHIRGFLKKQDWWFRALFSIAAVFIVLVFGIWGVGYEANSFIYFKF